MTDLFYIEHDITIPPTSHIWILFYCGTTAPYRLNLLPPDISVWSLFISCFVCH